MNLYDSMFFNYLKELEGQDAIADESGFLTYRIAGTECYVFNLYVTPAARGSKRAKALFSKLKQRCKEAGVKAVTCNVFKKDRGVNRNTEIYKSQGFETISENDNAITMIKEL